MEEVIFEDLREEDLNAKMSEFFQVDLAVIQQF